MSRAAQTPISTRRRSPKVFTIPGWDAGPHILTMFQTRSPQIFRLTIHGHIGIAIGTIRVRRTLGTEELDVFIARLAAALGYDVQEQVDEDVVLTDVFFGIRSEGGISMHIARTGVDHEISVAINLPREGAQQMLEWLAQRAGWDLED